MPKAQGKRKRDGEASDDEDEEGSDGEDEAEIYALQVCGRLHHECLADDKDRPASTPRCLQERKESGSK